MLASSQSLPTVSPPWCFAVPWLQFLLLHHQTQDEIQAPSMTGSLSVPPVSMCTLSPKPGGLESLLGCIQPLCCCTCCSFLVWKILVPYPVKPTVSLVVLKQADTLRTIQSLPSTEDELLGCAPALTFLKLQINEPLPICP